MTLTRRACSLKLISFCFPLSLQTNMVTEDNWPNVQREGWGGGREREREADSLFKCLSLPEVLSWLYFSWRGFCLSVHSINVQERTNTHKQDFNWQIEKKKVWHCLRPKCGCQTLKVLTNQEHHQLFKAIQVFGTVHTDRNKRIQTFRFSPHLKCCCFVFVLQMEVVSTFKRSGSFQGAVRRRSSVLSQLHDVNTISTPSHVALSTATANTSPAPGSESAHTHVHTLTDTRRALSFLNTHTHTWVTLLHGSWTAVILTTLSGCFPSDSLAARVCMQTSPLFPFFFSSFWLSLFDQTALSHPGLADCVPLLWSGQDLCCCWVSLCWSVSAGGGWLFSLSGGPSLD